MIGYRDVSCPACGHRFRVSTDPEQLRLDPVLMVAANSTGGVMGKMVDAQSIVVATAATNQVGNEGQIFKFVVWHSLALATFVGLIVLTYAYVFPGAVPHGIGR